MVLGLESTTIVLLEASERVFVFLFSYWRREERSRLWMGFLGVLGECTVYMRYATLRYASVL